MAVTRQGTDTSSTTSAATYPTVTGGILAGDLLILTAVCVATLTTPTGWSIISNVSVSAGGPVVDMTVYGKLAAGGETGTVTVTGATCCSLGVRRGNLQSSVALACLGASTASATTTAAAISSPQLTGVPVGAWLESMASIKVSALTPTCTVSGSNWSQDTDPANLASDGLSTASNSTDTGTANICTHTFSETGPLRGAISFYIPALPSFSSASSLALTAAVARTATLAGSTALAAQSASMVAATSAGVTVARAASTATLLSAIATSFHAPYVFAAASSAALVAIGASVVAAT